MDGLETIPTTNPLFFLVNPDAQSRYQLEASQRLEGEEVTNEDGLVHVLKVEIAQILQAPRPVEDAILLNEIAHEVGHALLLASVGHQAGFGSSRPSTAVPFLQQGILDHPYVAGVQFDFTPYGYDQSPDSIVKVGWLVGLLDEAQAWWVAAQLARASLDGALDRVAREYVRAMTLARSEERRDFLLIRSVVISAVASAFGVTRTALSEEVMVRRG